MIYVFEEGNVVFDGSTISEEQKAKAVAVELLPVAEVMEGKIAVLRANKTTKIVYYIYIDIPHPERPTELEELSNYVLDVDFRVMMIEMVL